MLGAYRAYAPNPDDAQVAALIVAGESDRVEFKVAAYWNAKTGKKETSMRDNIVQAVAAFLNSAEGGVVLIGVENATNKVVGLREDYAAANEQKRDRDGYELALRDAIGSVLDHSIGGEDVCRISVRPSPEVVYLNGDLYARIGNAKRRSGMLMDVTVEPYRAEHRDAVVQLSLRAWAPVFDSLRGVLGPAVYAVLFPDWRVSQQQAVGAVCDGEECRVWVALDAGAPVGFVAVKLHAAEKVGEAYMIAVDPAAQRRGIASALMNVATDWMREAGMLVAMVATGGDPGHAPARQAYEKLGFGLLPLAQYYKLL